MTPKERAELNRLLGPTPGEVKAAKFLRAAFWVAFLLVFVILPILRPLWS